MKRKVKSMLIIFFDIKGIASKELFLAVQRVSSTYCCDTLRLLRANVGRFCLELWRQKNQLLHHDNTVSHLFFTKKTP
jgi:hypothetical protein